jgi:tripartite-type tricarboxylate transporter receptor subunit TctC
MKPSSFVLCAMLSLTGATSAFAQAQSYPTRPIRLIVPAEAGSTSDVLVRIVTNQLPPSWTIVVENKPGASANIGANEVAKSTPDGYTLGVGATTHLVNIALKRQAPFDFMTDVVGVDRLVGGAQIIVAHPSTGFKTLNDMIAKAKAEPGFITYATGGPGTPNHIAIARLMNETGTTMLQVPFKSDTGGFDALLGGHVMVMSAGLALSKSQVDKGNLNALAVTSLERNPAYPNVPTVKEILGNDNVESTSYWGIIAPKGTPKPILDLLAAEYNKALNKPEVKTKIVEMGYIPVGSSPEEYDAHFKSELNRLNALVKAANIKVEQ